jgi:hypothetical protein
MLLPMRQLTQAEKVFGFRVHALTFVVVVLLLMGINLSTGAPYWAQWALLSWGTGLACHWWWGIGPGARRRRALW